MCSKSATSRDGSRYGSGLTRVASTKAKMAVLAAMPNANTRMAVTAKPGLWLSCRAAKRRSWRMVARNERVALQRCACFVDIERALSGLLTDLVVYQETIIGFS